jgi:hypothetical protein
VNANTSVRRRIGGAPSARREGEIGRHQEAGDQDRDRLKPAERRDDARQIDRIEHTGNAGDRDHDRQERDP